VILGVGIDIVHVDRLVQWLGKPGLVERFFHADELVAARARGAAAALSLAARFAAKEAFGKACGGGLRGMSLKDIRVRNDEGGKPSLVLEGGALERFESIGGRAIHVSLTHESENAVAMVVIEG
jgi:holo-[acyl-carrier protein] synthase